VPVVPRSTTTQILVGLSYIALATLACVMPVHNDTWWHLRSGEEMVRTHHLLFVDHFSSTAQGAFFWNHSWLSQVIFYLIFSVAGLAGVTALCAALVIGAWVLVWRLMRGDTAIRLVLLALAVSSATTIWSVRPQAFSVFLLALTVWLLCADRWQVMPLVMALWANLHAGFAIGIVVLAAWVVDALLNDRPRLARRMLAATAATAATLITPLGVANWKELIASMGRSRANQIQEWMPPEFSGPHVIFWAMAAWFVVEIALEWRRLPHGDDRVLALSGLLVLPLAARSLRNIPAFMLLAAPALSRMLARDHTVSAKRAEGRAGQRAGFGVVALGVAAAAAIAIVVRAWTSPWGGLGWQPMTAAAARAIARCPGPLYNTYEGGGPLIWFVPSQRVFVDSRQDPFPDSLVRAGAQVEATGDYRAVFERFRFNCAAIPPESPTARALVRDGWRRVFQDDQWSVLVHPQRAELAPTHKPTATP
jgi:hypothetical protein